MGLVIKGLTGALGLVALTAGFFAATVLALATVGLGLAVAVAVGLDAFFFSAVLAGAAFADGLAAAGFEAVDAGLLGADLGAALGFGAAVLGAVAGFAVPEAVGLEPEVAGAEAGFFSSFLPAKKSKVVKKRFKVMVRHKIYSTY